MLAVPTTNRKQNVIHIDPEAGTVVVDDADGSRSLLFDDPEAFRIVSDAWLRIGWDTKYVYGFSWLGRPVIQLPEDMMRVQEVISHLRPDVIVETGIAHGGSLVFYASVCHALGKGCVVGVDIEIRPHNRKAVESHELSGYITMIEGSSTDAHVVEQVRALIQPDDVVLVLLDSNHTKDHVLTELEAYAPLVSVGSWIVAADGIMAQVAGAPRTEQDWTWNNPMEAATEFLATHPEFALEEPVRPFNEGSIVRPVTYWPGGWLRRVS